MAGSAKRSALKILKDNSHCPVLGCDTEWQATYSENTKDNLRVILAMSRIIQAHMRGHEIDCKLALDRYDSMEENAEDEKKDS